MMFRLRETPDCIIVSCVCQDCGLTFQTNAAYASHMAKVHGRAARSTIAAQGSFCHVCGTEYWSTKRLRQHFKQSRRCLRITEQADLDTEPVVPNQSSFAWLPAIRQPAPLPWWATLDPPSPPKVARPTAPLWQGLLSKFLACEISDVTAWQSQARKIVETRAWKDVAVEDLPLTLFQQPRGMRDLVKALIAVCNFDLPLSGDCVFGAWRVSGRADRIVLGPSGTGPMPSAAAEWLQG